MTDPTTRVLLVDDDLFLAARILSVLDGMGCQTETARTEEEALRISVACPPDLVIVNMTSARTGGTGLIRRLKTLTPAPRVLAFLSHVKIPDARDAILAAGADKLCANSAVSLRLPALVRDILGDRGPQEEM